MPLSGRTLAHKVLHAMLEAGPSCSCKAGLGLFLLFAVRHTASLSHPKYPIRHAVAGELCRVRRISLSRLAKGKSLNLGPYM